jgi:hypothetical protein
VLQREGVSADTQGMRLKEMALRHSGACRVCGVELPAKATAVYDFTAKDVLCLACRDNEPAAQREPAPEDSRRQQDRRVGDRRLATGPTESSRGGSVLQWDS